jgi:hypothetical protein
MLAKRAADCVLAVQFGGAVVVEWGGNVGRPRRCLKKQQSPI